MGHTAPPTRRKRGQQEPSYSLGCLVMGHLEAPRVLPRCLWKCFAERDEDGVVGLAFTIHDLP